MFDESHYIPILKAKLGEFGAVNELSATERMRFTPFFDVPPVPWDYVEDTPSKPLRDHLSAISKKLRTNWGVVRPFFVDLFAIGLEERTEKGEHPLDFIIEDLGNRGLKPIPTTGLDRDDAYQSALANAVPALGRGFCLRLLVEDIERHRDERLRVEMDTLIQMSQISPRDVHLLLDLRNVQIAQIAERVNLIAEALSGLPYIDDWNTVTLAASGFPLDLTDHQPDSAEYIPRAELALWMGVRERCGDLTRIPAFADYGIAHPDLMEIDPRAMQMSANIRYAVDGRWLVIKGRGVRKYKFTQFHELSRLLRARPDYMGPLFSWGDRYIDLCAREEVGTGNATTWRKVGTNHHLAVVLGERAQLADS